MIRGAVLALRPYLYVDPDRHENVRVYVRKNGRKLRVQCHLEANDFPANYKTALDQLDKKLAEEADDPNAPPKPGTFGWLVEEYIEKSSSFKQLGGRGQRIHAKLLRETAQEPLDPKNPKFRFKGVPIQDLAPKHFKALRDGRMATPGMANVLLKYIRVMFEWGIEERDEYVTCNVAREVKKLDSSRRRFHTRTIEEFQQYAERHPLGTKAFLALALLLFTGLRRSDVILLGEKTRKGDWFTLVPKKTKKKLKDGHTIPVLPVLQKVMDASGNVIGEEAYLETEFGAPFASGAAFGNRMRDRCDEAGLTQCAAHGLRKVGATFAAENGATEKQLMAMYNWETSKQASHYTKIANKKKLAGDAMLLIAMPLQLASDAPAEEQEVRPGRRLHHFSDWMCPTDGKA